MVTRSTDNYEQHKKDVYLEIKKRFGEERADKFIKFYSSRWDKFQRSYIDYRVAFKMVDEYYWVKKVGTRFYAIVGSGGTGKSTLAINLFYFLDTTFDIKRANITTVSDFLDKLDEYPKIGAMKSLYMDEPDNQAHSLSKEGKKIADVAGRWRQQQMFLGILATDIRDIPLTLFNKLHGIIYLPKHGTGIMYRDSPNKEQIVMNALKKDYKQIGYAVFYKYINKFPNLRFSTHKGVIFNEEELKEYKKIKADDYSKTIKEAKQILNKNSKKYKQNPHLKEILKLKKKGLSYREISKKIGITPGRISQILSKNAV